MSIWSRSESLLRNLFRRTLVESQLDEELQAYVTLLTDEKKARGMPAAEALALFPDGPADFAACFSRWADRRMFDRLESLPLDKLRVPERIALAVNTRLEIVEPWREAVRRALTILSLPQNTPLAMRLLYETVDGIWYAAGDSAARPGSRSARTAGPASGCWRRRPRHPARRSPAAPAAARPARLPTVRSPGHPR